MFIAMNRFRIHSKRADDFITIWKNRDSYLNDVPGFVRFSLLQGDSNDGITLFASQTEWQDRAAFEAWLKSESFRKAHANAGQQNEGIYAGPPQLELFDAVL